MDKSPVRYLGVGVLCSPNFLRILPTHEEKNTPKCFSCVVFVGRTCLCPRRSLINVSPKLLISALERQLLQDFPNLIRTVKFSEELVTVPVSQEFNAKLCPTFNNNTSKKDLESY